MAALVALCNARQASLASMRVARVAGAAIGLAMLAPMAVLAARGGRDVLDVLAIRGLALLSWGAAGLAALGAAGDLAGRDRADGAEALALQRGFAARQLGTARVLAAIRRIAVVTGVPALGLCGVALATSPSARVAGQRAALCVAVALYVLLLATALGALARWAARVSPRRGRWLLVAVLIVPELANALWPAVPGVIGGFGWLLHQIIFLGGGAA